MLCYKKILLLPQLLILFFQTNERKQKILSFYYSNSHIINLKRKKHVIIKYENFQFQLEVSFVKKHFYTEVRDKRNFKSLKSYNAVDLTVVSVA